MEEKKTIKISLSTFFLIIAIIIICIMGYFLFKMNSDKLAETDRTAELQSEVNTVNENRTNKIAETISNNETISHTQQNEGTSNSNASEYNKAVTEIRKCLKDDSWLKQNIYITKEEMIGEDANISDQQINFIICKSYAKPIIVVETSSENARAHKIDLITYENNNVKVERLDQGHIYHGGFDIDANKLIVRSSYMHMGTSATMLQSIANGNISFIGAYMSAEDTINSTIDKVLYKYYIKSEKDKDFDKEVSENEYKEYKEALNEKQYNFVTINTKLTAQNIDKYLY